PFTMGIIYYPGYLLGSVILRYQPVRRIHLEGRFGEIAALPWAQRISEYAGMFFEEIMYPTFVGSAIIGLLLAVAVYFLTVWAVKRYRNRRKEKLAARLRRRGSPTEEISKIKKQISKRKKRYHHEGHKVENKEMERKRKN
ncbi:MAG: DUF2062 domain-containing protein, partial [Actinobacteria bacterium]|nr:DUF2062 domain-containing protein [Actinomycetota bacterium]